MTNRRAFIASLLGALGLSRFVKPELKPPTYTPNLYQQGISVNWRAIVDDDLKIFSDISKRLADASNMRLSDVLNQFAENSGFTWGATPDGRIEFRRISRLRASERRFNPSRLPA
jgi:hypothetical protein